MTVKFFPVSSSIPGASAIIHVKKTESPTGPELYRKIECRIGGGGRPAMALHEEGRSLRSWRLPVRIVGTIIERMSNIAVACWKFYRLRRRKVVLNSLQAVRRNQRLDRQHRSRVHVDGRNCRRRGHGGATQHYGRCRRMYTRQGGKFHRIVVSG